MGCRRAKGYPAVPDGWRFASARERERLAMIGPGTYKIGLCFLGGIAVKFGMHEHDDHIDDLPVMGIEDVISTDGRYRPEAFGLLHEGLARAVKDTHGREQEEGDNHVTGQQLCESIRDLAMDRYGMMARAVLQMWGVTGSLDFGNMVYLLIENGYMRKTEEDSLNDFKDVFLVERDLTMNDTIRMQN